MRFLLRPLTEPEFDTWAAMTAGVYGQDWRPGGLRNARETTSFDRTIAAFDDGEIVAGAAIFSRNLTVPGAVVPVAGVTLVAVSPTHRRRGLLTAMMGMQLTGLYESGETVAALSAAEAGIYGRFGYGPASQVARLRGVQRAMAFRPDVHLGAGRIRLLDREKALPLISQVYDRVRRTSVGWVDRPARFWEARLSDSPGATSLRYAVHSEPDGAVTGYALYRLRPEGNGTGDVSEVQVVELAAATRQAYAAVWRFLLDLDGHFRISALVALDEPLPLLLADPRGARLAPVDNLWVRLVDVERALAARRYATPVDVVLEVCDGFCPWNNGRYRLVADGSWVTCVRTSAPADLSLTAADLGAVYLGGTTLATLAAAGRVVEQRPGALARSTVAFRGEREPFHPSGAAFPAY